MYVLLQLASHCRELVHAGGLAVLQRLYEARGNQQTVVHTLARILANLTLCEDLHEDIVQAGGYSRAQWFRGRASDSHLREPGFESCAAVLRPSSFLTLHCSSSLSCIHEYLAIDSDGYVYEQPSRFSCSIWLDAS